MSFFIKRENCPVCGGSDVEILIERSIQDKDFIKFIELEPTYKENFYNDLKKGVLKDQIFKAVKCSRCSFIFQQFVLNETGMGKLYNEWLDHAEVMSIINSANRVLHDQRFAERINYVKRHFKNEKINILDWGAGLGHFCLVAKKMGNVNVYAYDFSNEKNRHLEEAGIIVKNEQELDLKFFHFINIDQVLEHVSDPVGLLTGCTKYLREDGIIFISTPLCNTIEKKLKNNNLDRETFEQLSPHQHINAFTNQTLKGIGKEVGLKTLFEPYLQLSSSYYNKNSDGYVKNIIKPFYRQWMSTSLFFKRINAPSPAS
ncbi:MAG TPA: class I SAM-dependent methyltransferase [Chitinophagaceae bacterium]|nr:class I SAM-dependent methyltransferase [Chitinophagaceae bacterium]